MKQDVAALHKSVRETNPKGNIDIFQPGPMFLCLID